MPRRVDDDDEVQIISKRTWNARKRDSFICQMCAKDLANLSVGQRQDHYEGHFGANHSTAVGFKPREPSYNRRLVDRSSFRRKYKPYHKWIRFPCTEVDVFWYNGQEERPPPNSTPGLVSLLKKALCKSHSRGSTYRAALCHSSTVHVRRDVWDSNWGCGYRNYLMVCSALLCQQAQPEYYPLIINGSRTPGVRSLQRLIQEAWEAGFDQEGQQELKQLVGTSKWIGTSDLYVAFSYCGIPCELIEFNLEESHERLLEALVGWVVNYFTPVETTSQLSDINEVFCGASPVTVTERMPLVLQHQGHSRTVVGYEISKDGRTNLLVFDPSFHVDNRLRDAAMKSSRQANGSKRPISDCTESSSSAQSTLRSAPHANKPIVIDIDDDITNQVGNRRAGRMRGGTNSLVPSEEKVSNRLLGVCRLSLGDLRKQKRYQILHCTMAPPLSSEEKAARMVVTSMMVS
ncbi:hypothetical protein M378DRAFT_7433 [Amanita muscaria Koide BX008]|uniref:UFSP1/2/DUB catalytic domain-containing protein n=1 Tax=Amanita muscaria (strain Koide BX008) TaxID=946122 RepID=A0A0C2X5K3_AMAMK|nr:hypothetical protein M378DRAFT_7433 [Amanita muscaria Koide BX008]